MALTNDQITALNFKDFYSQIRPYLNGSGHGGFTPIGTVISVMGKTAPHNYLICNGAVYNIEDYPELAAYFAGQFNSSNFFGGDGITTFAVPDLRGEFLRGTGANGHSGQGAGSSVGVHQDATLFPNYFGSTGSTGTIDVAKTSVTNRDSSTGATGKARYASASDTGSTYDTNFTSRPTNTSVLYCIATKNIFMDAGSNYSLDEQVVGTWVNGKPLYQKTIIISGCSPNTWNTTAHNIANVDDVVEETAMVRCTNGTIYCIGFRTTEVCGMIQATATNVGCYLGTHTVYNNAVVTITIKYTKTTD